MNHEGDIVTVTPGTVSAVCSCGWGGTYDNHLDAATAWGRHMDEEQD